MPLRHIQLPPLRERKEDILDLIHALLARINKQLGRDVRQLSMDVITCLQDYHWPGNVREMENILANAVALCPGNVITRDLMGDLCDPRSAFLSSSDAQPLSQCSLDDITRIHIKRVLEAIQWHKGQACDVLGISRPRLRRVIKQDQLTAPDGALDEDDEDDSID